MPAAFLTLELTESFLMADSGRSIAVLDELVRASASGFDRRLRHRLLLAQPPEAAADRRDQDRPLVRDGHARRRNDFMIVRATIDLGKNLGLRVVAEGVEDRETFDRLADFGCDEAQGYYISRPMPLDEFNRWLSVRTPRPSCTRAPWAHTDVQTAGRGRCASI